MNQQQKESTKALIDEIRQLVNNSEDHVFLCVQTQSFYDQARSGFGDVLAAKWLLSNNKAYMKKIGNNAGYGLQWVLARDRPDSSDKHCYTGEFEAYATIERTNKARLAILDHFETLLNKVRIKE